MQITADLYSEELLPAVSIELLLLKPLEFVRKLQYKWFLFSEEAMHEKKKSCKVYAWHISFHQERFLSVYLKQLTADKLKLMLFKYIMLQKQPFRDALKKRYSLDLGKTFIPVKEFILSCRQVRSFTKVFLANFEDSFTYFKS